MPITCLSVQIPRENSDVPLTVSLVFFLALKGVRGNNCLYRLSVQSRKQRYRNKTVHTQFGPKVRPRQTNKGSESFVAQSFITIIIPHYNLIVYHREFIVPWIHSLKKFEDDFGYPSFRHFWNENSIISTHCFRRHFSSVNRLTNCYYLFDNHQMFVVLYELLFT